MTTRRSPASTARRSARSDASSMALALPVNQWIVARGSSARATPASSPIASDRAIVSSTPVPELVDRHPLRIREEAQPELSQQRAFLERSVVRRLGRGRQLVEHPSRPFDVSGLQQAVVQRHERLQPERLVGRQEPGGAPQESDGCGHVAACRRPPSGDRQPRARASGQRPRMVVARPQLDQVSVRLLQVVPEDLLVLLDARARPRLQPVGEPLVQVGPELLRDRLVRGVADEDVPEPVEVGGGLGARAPGAAAPCGRGIAPGRRRPSPRSSSAPRRRRSRTCRRSRTRAGSPRVPPAPAGPAGRPGARRSWAAAPRATDRRWRATTVPHGPGARRRSASTRSPRRRTGSRPPPR